MVSALLPYACLYSLFQVGTLLGTSNAQFQDEIPDSETIP